MSGNQVLTINIGQCGIQLGNSVWELLCIEHGVGPDGDIFADVEMNRFGCFFQESNNNLYSPRVIFVDTEPTVIDEIRNGPYRKLYHPDMLISGKEDASNNFARGSFFVGTEVLKTFRSSLHKHAEQMDSFETLMLFNGVGGGTGSGTAALFLQQALLDFPKVVRMQMPVFPGPLMSSAVVEPFNCIFHAHTTMETVDIAIIFDNEALYDMCTKLLLISSPTFTDLNRLLATIVSSLTCSMRFDAALKISLQEFHTNLIPYPRIHFPFIRHAPLQHLSRVTYENKSVDDITRDVFSRDHQTLKCDSYRGKYISVLLNYRGLISPREMTDSIYKQKSKMSFVEWCPTGFKVGLNHQCPVSVPDCKIALSEKSVTMVTNNTSIRELWSRLIIKFDLLFDRRAFVHWYVMEGMEESEFGESRLDVQLLIEDYDEIGMTEAEILEAMENNPEMRSKLSSRHGESIGPQAGAPEEQMIDVEYHNENENTFDTNEY